MLICVLNGIKIEIEIQLLRGNEKVIYTEFFILIELCAKQNARD